MKVVEKERSAKLIEQMDEAGCVFKFVVLSPDPQDKVDESYHRQGLVVLHEELMNNARQWHESLMQDKKYEGYPEPFISWELENAISTPLNLDEIRSLTLTDSTDVFERLALYASFINPPYRARFKKGVETKGVFNEWCDVLGLNELDDVSVLNWVEGFHTGLHEKNDTSSVAPWSNYFYPGLEWWGVWCLTIWNPKRRTLSALIASTTD
ncbi:hypothetical protein [Pseudomonas sp. SDO5532_S415]